MGRTTIRAIVMAAEALWARGDIRRLAGLLVVGASLTLAPVAAHADPLTATCGDETNGIVSCNLGVVIAVTNVNASIYDPSDGEVNTYTYNQLLQDPRLPSAMDDILSNLGYPEYNGVLDFDFTSYRASGTYIEQGSDTPLCPDASDGTLCPGTIAFEIDTSQPSSGAISPDIAVNPIDAATTYQAILGKAPGDVDNGYPTSSTSTVILSLGLFECDDANLALFDAIGIQSCTQGVNYDVTGEDVTTDWESSGVINSSEQNGGNPAPVPEPSTVWLLLTGAAPLAIRRARRQKPVLGPTSWGQGTR